MSRHSLHAKRRWRIFSILLKNHEVPFFLLLFVALCAGTYVTYQAVKTWTDTVIQEEFDLTAQNASYLLWQRIENVQEIMRGAKGLHDASETTGRDEWQTYFRATDIAEEHKELYIISYIERVKDENKAVFIDGVRRDTSTGPAGYPGFTVFPESQKDEYFVVKYTEPATLEATALGFDVSTDPVRFQTLVQARDTGKIAMTPFIKFVTGMSGPSMYLPVYQKGAPIDTPAERSQAVTGFVVTGLSVPEFFQEIFQAFRFPTGFSIRIYEGGPDGQDRMPFYSSTTRNDRIEEGESLFYRRTDLLEIGGQTWQMESTATSAFRRSTQFLPFIILVAGGTVSLIFLSIVIFIVFSYRRMLRGESKHTEELHAVNQFLDSIIENIPDMIFVKDAKELRFVRFNKAGEELLGYRRSDLIGKNDYDFFPKKEADFFIEKDKAVLTQGMLLDIPMEPIKSRYKGERTLHTKKIPLLDSEGNPRYLLGISEDITEHLREEKAKAEFVTLVSHQLRTPLAAMRWSFEILKERTLHFSDTERRLMNQSYAAMLNMTQTIDTMLAIAHIDTGKVVVNPEELSLTDMLKLLVETYSVEAEGRNLHLALDASGDCSLRSDANLLREVFSNLLSNAMQYTPDGGAINVVVRQEGEESVVLVTDTGIGIPEGEMKSVFEKLFRAENAKKMRAGGSGLGLYVVHSLVTSLGGTVSVVSEEGKGSTFTVRLPILPSA